MLKVQHILTCSVFTTGSKVAKKLSIYFVIILNCLDAEVGPFYNNISLIILN